MAHAIRIFGYPAWPTCRANCCSWRSPEAARAAQPELMAASVNAFAHDLSTVARTRARPTS